MPWACSDNLAWLLRWGMRRTPRLAEFLSPKPDGPGNARGGPGIILKVKTFPPSPSLLNGRYHTLAAPVASTIDPVYDILIEDADGRQVTVWNASETWRSPRQAFAFSSPRNTPVPGLILWNQEETRAILAATDGY